MSDTSFFVFSQPNSQNPTQLTKLNSPNSTQPIQLTQRNSAFSFFQTSNQDLIGMDVPCTDNNRQLELKAYIYQRTVSMNLEHGGFLALLKKTKSNSYF